MFWRDLHLFIGEGDAEEEEDDAVTHRGSHFREVFDSIVTLFGDIVPGILPLKEPAGDDAQNAGPVEEFGKEISQVGRGEDGEGFHHSHMIGEFGDK